MFILWPPYNQLQLLCTVSFGLFVFLKRESCCHRVLPQAKRAREREREVRAAIWMIFIILWHPLSVIFVSVWLFVVAVGATTTDHKLLTLLSIRRVAYIVCSRICVCHWQTSEDFCCKLLLLWKFARTLFTCTIQHEYFVHILKNWWSATDIIQQTCANTQTHSQTWEEEKTTIN